MNKLLIVSALILTGCATSEFTPYEGAQDNWRTGSGALVDRRHAVPVYHGPPSRPYKVLGMLATGNTWTEGESLSAAASKARAMGGDAIVILEVGSTYAGSYSTGTATAIATGRTATAYGSGITVPLTSAHSKVVVIKWK